VENGGVPVVWLTGGRLEVGEKLQGVEAVHQSYLAGARTAGRAGPYGDPGRRQEGSQRRGGCGAQRAMEGLASFMGSRRSC
jgi:hypothetical protein